VALLGAGEMGYLAALHLKQAGTLSIDVFNRTIEKAMEMAEEVGASAKSLSDLDEELHHYDIVIGATGSPLPVLTEEMVSKALTIRKGSPIIMVDIALPRDMESSIQNLPSAYLFNIDDLQGVIEDNKNKRENSSQEAEKIIAEKSEEFKVWYHSQKVKPTIKTLRQNLENISSKEIEKYKNKLDPNSYEVAKELVHSILGKWLHDPMEELKSLSDEGYSKEASQIVNRIFRLEKSTEDASKKD
jgi:glutamyl-tRNA reductase